LYVFVTAQLVEAADSERILLEPVTRAGGFELVVGEDLERELEFAVQLVLPLLDQHSGQMTKQRCKSPRIISSLISKPAMMVLPAPGSSASK